jgi:hypothetical protein
MKIPGPSLKPLPQRSYDRTTPEETKVISDAEVKAHFAPKKPEPKLTYSEKDKKWALDMLTQLAQYKLSLPSDYKCEIERQSDLAMKAKRSAKSGKQIPQLEEQKNQSVPLLIIGPTDIHTSFRAEMDKDWELWDPRVIAAAGALGMTIMQAKETATKMNLSLLVMLGIEEAPMGQIVQKYVLGAPLIIPEEEDSLSTHMQNLLGWYKVHIQNKDFKQYFTAMLERSITLKDT